MKNLYKKGDSTEYSFFGGLTVFFLICGFIGGMLGMGQLEEQNQNIDDIDKASFIKGFGHFLISPISGGAIITMVWGMFFAAPLVMIFALIGINIFRGR